MITADSVLRELEQLIYREVVRINDEKTALSCTEALVKCLHLNFKNRLMYIPSTNKDDKLQLQQLYAKIYNEFTGNNQQELAIKYRRSEQNIYAITKREKQKHIKKIQSDLFPQDQTTEAEKKPTTLLVIEDYLPNELTHLGLSNEQAKSISVKISTHLCATFPGVSIYISEATKNKRVNENQTSIF